MLEIYCGVYNTVVLWTVERNNDGYQLLILKPVKCKMKENIKKMIK